VEALAAWEEKAGILEKALAKVHADLDMEWTKAEATQKDYLDKMIVHTARPKHSLSLDKMLGEKKVELDRRERDLELHEEAQTRGLDPRVNCDELMEFVEPRRLLQDTEVDYVFEVEWRATLVRDVSKVLVDLGLPPITEVP
jgi:hypothetical protein